MAQSRHFRTAARITIAAFVLFGIFWGVLRAADFGSAVNPTQYTVELQGHFLGFPATITVLPGTSAALPAGTYHVSVKKHDGIAVEGCGEWQLQTTEYGKSLTLPRTAVVHAGKSITVRCLGYYSPQ